MNQTELQQVVENSVRKVFAEFWSKNLPPSVQGDRRAGKLLGISAEAMKMRRRNGFYRDGVDFKKKGGIIIWNTDALLNIKRTNDE